MFEKKYKFHLKNKINMMGLCQFHISCIIIYYESILILTDKNKRQEKSRRKYENTHYRYSIKMSLQWI